ncbi:MAG TPA: pyridoxamine 5'-phosphate oxidase family protein [Acidimicrobiales bacterium]|nr:pyridoxamine 5'-phosphate oxidase family protein [Acidimicrobiales bacterium]
MYETPEEMERLQALLDASMAAGGRHLRDVITDDRRLGATELSGRLSGMRLLVLSTVTADGRPLSGPIDGYFLHGTFWFSSARDGVRMRHLRARPALSATHLPGEELAVTVHGRAELFDLNGPEGAELLRAMVDFYEPKQGPAFEESMRQADALGARIVPEKMFTFHLDAAAQG